MIDSLWHGRTLILFVIGAAILFLTFRSLRAQRLKERYVLLFLLTGVPFVLLAMWPDAVVAISRFLEIEKPTLLVMCVTVYFILTTFELLSIVSVQGRHINTLGQHQSMLMEEQRRLRAAIDRHNKPSEKLSQHH